MHAYHDKTKKNSVVAFLDIKAAYDTVDRRIIWKSMLASSTPVSLVSLLSHLFDDVSISILLKNSISTPFSPSTGVLQGSVLSPHLYSIYIDTLPALLRAAFSPLTTSIMSLSPSGPPGFLHGSSSGVPSGLPFGPSIPPHSLTPSPTPINCLLYAEYVAALISSNPS